MTGPLAIVLGLLAAAVVMFTVGRPRSDVVGLLMIAALPLSGVLTVPQALAGFADANVVLIAMMFVVGDGLVRTGVAQRLGDLMIARAGRGETRLVVLLMAAVGLVGSTMSSTGVVAIFIPVALRVARNANIPPGRIMMPLSVAALVSGMMTLVATTPNLVVQAELIRNGHRGFRFFTFLPFGATMIVLAVAYMLVARRWLPGPRGAGAGGDDDTSRRPTVARWIEEYDLAGRHRRFRLLPGSPLTNQAMRDLSLRARQGMNVVAVDREAPFGRRRLLRPVGQTRLEAGDVLVVDLFDPAADAGAIARDLLLEQEPITGRIASDLSQEIGMAEAMVPDNSALIGKSVVESGFRSRHGLTLVGLKHGSTTVRGDVQHERLRVGDTLLVVGPWPTIRSFAAGSPDLVVLGLPAEVDDVVPAASRAPLAVAAMLVVIGLMVSGVVPNVLAALLGCLLLGLFGCIDANAAYRSIHWQTLILIVGMIPFSVALQKTGGVDLASAAFVRAAGDASPRLVLAGLFAVTAGFGLFISNTATAILMAPVALAVAKQMGASPYPFAMTVALAASTAFVTPVSSPVNTLVAGPGGYTFTDFVRIGLPLAIISLLTAVLLVPYVLPLYP